MIINGRTERRVGDAIATIRQKHLEARLEACAGDLSTAATAERVAGQIHPRRYFDQQPRLIRAPSCLRPFRIRIGRQSLKRIS